MFLQKQKYIFACISKRVRTCWLTESMRYFPPVSNGFNLRTFARVTLVHFLVTLVGKFTVYRRTLVVHTWEFYCI